MRSEYFEGHRLINALCRRAPLYFKCRRELLTHPQEDANDGCVGQAMRSLREVKAAGHAWHGLNDGQCEYKVGCLTVVCLIKE